MGVRHSEYGDAENDTYEVAYIDLNGKVHLLDEWIGYFDVIAAVLDVQQY